jgi:hypothetical protein
MGQETKNSMSVQPATQSADAALKLFSVNPKDKVNKEPVHKDGDDGDEPPVVQSYTIEVGLNGFFITVMFNDDTPDLRYIAETMDDVVKILKDHF